MADKAPLVSVKVYEKIFDMMKNKVLKAKKNNLQARPTGYGFFFFNEVSNPIENIENGKITHEEALKIRKKAIKTPKQ